MIVYGRNPVREALRDGAPPPSGRSGRRLQAAREPWLAERGPKLAPAEEIEALSGSSSHQGVCADAGPYPYLDGAELLSGDQPLLVVLDQVQDPQNLGSVCRTAECAGADGVVIPERRAAEVTAYRAICKTGAVEHLAVARVRNLADFLLEARDAGCWSYGASASEQQGRAPVPYDSPDYRGSGVILVLGSEGSGLRPRVAGACDELIALPVRGRVGSLNVSAAASAILYEILQTELDSSS